MVDSIEAAKPGLTIRYSGVRPLAPVAPDTPLEPRTARRALTRLERLQVALEKIRESPIRAPLRRTPAAASLQPLGLRYSATFASLRSTEEVNATPTAYTPTSPSFAGASTAAPAIGGVYDGAQGSTLLTFSALHTSVVGSGLPLSFEVRDGEGSLIETVDYQGAAADTPVALANGLTLALGAGLVELGDGFEVSVSTTGGVVDPNAPFDGAPGFEAGTSVVAGAFEVNGVAIDVFADDTLLGVLARITGSAAGVTASFDSDTEQVVLTQKTAGAGPGIALANDTSGFLAATKLAGALVDPGLAPDPDRTLQDMAALAGISSGTFSLNGIAIAVDPSVDSLRDVLERIDAAGAGAVTALSVHGDRVGLRASGRTSLVLADGTSGFFTALGVATGTFTAETQGSSAFAQPTRVQAQIEAIAEELNDLLGEGLAGFGSELGSAARQGLAALVREAFGRATSDTGADVLRSRFGSVAVRFGEPISLAEVTGLAPRSHAAEAAHLRKVAARLGDEISRRINDLITAGRSSVSAVALLGGRGQGLRVRDFRERVVEVVALLDLAGLARSGNLARDLAEGRPEAAIDLLEHSGLVGRRRSAGGDIFEFDDEGREALAYYRATLSPALIWPAALALAMRVRPGQKPEELRSEAAAWVDLLRLEYFPPALEAALTQLDRFLEHFVERGWLEISNSGRVQLLPEGERWMAFLAHSLRPVLETYAALFEAAVQHEGDVRRHRLLAAAETILEEHLLLGEAQCPESLCKTTLGNALALLVADGVLSLQGNLRDPDAELSRGPRWEGLDARSQRVARALADG